MLSISSLTRVCLPFFFPIFHTYGCWNHLLCRSTHCLRVINTYRTYIIFDYHLFGINVFNTGVQLFCGARRSFFWKNAPISCRHKPRHSVVQMVSTSSITRAVISPDSSVNFIIFHIDYDSCYKSLIIEVWKIGSEPTIIRRLNSV